MRAAHEERLRQISDKTVIEGISHSIRGDYVRISRWLSAPEGFTRTIYKDEHFALPMAVTVDCQWHEAHHKFEIVELTITPAPDGDPITSQLIRKVPVGELVERATRGHLILHARAHTPVGEMSTSRAETHVYDNYERLRAAGPVTETLEWASLVYDIARVEGDKPTQTVSEAFGISLRTASNWVRAAREQGLLDG